MTDSIFGERFYGTRTPAWHQLGQVFKKALKPSVAVKQVGLDYEVGKYELFAYPVKGKKVQSAKMTILRSPTKDDNQWREFGTAGGKYEIVQNTELADILDPLAEVWPLETMGAIDLGKTVFMTLNTGGHDIEGDPVNGYFMLVDVKDGGTATKLVYTPVRVVCKNTLVTGLRQASVSVSVQHITGAKAQLKARVDLIAKAKKAIDETTEVFRQLATTRVKPKQVDEMLELVYKLPRTPEDAALVDYDKVDLGDVLFQSVQDSMYAYNYYTAQAQKRQGVALELYEKLNDEYPQLAGTAWHAYNAVVESADYRLGGKSPETSTLFGARAREKKRAFDWAVAVSSK